MRKTVIIASIALLSACGKKGDLIPPEALVPGQVESFRVIQKGKNFQLAWNSPSKEQGGRPLRDLAGFRLLKREVLPKEIDCSSCPDSWQLLSTIDLDFPDGLKKSGNYFIFQDTGVKPDATVQYRLVAFSKNGGISRPVTTDSLKKLVASSPPLLQAKILPTAIRLTFAQQPTPGEAATGFNIYRRLPDEPSPSFPINSVPLTSAEWEDQMLQYGQTYLYTATTVSTQNSQQVESDPSNEVRILFNLPALE